MAACKVCKKSEASMLCICEECLESLKSEFELYDKDRSIRNLKEEKDLMSERFFNLAKEKYELESQNRELVQNLLWVKKQYDDDYTEKEIKELGELSKRDEVIYKTLEELLEKYKGVE